MFGIVLKVSEMDSETFLVKFYNNKIFYCHVNALLFEKQFVDSTEVLSREERDITVKVFIEYLTKQHGNLLKSALYSITVKVLFCNTISVKNILKCLKPIHF